MNKVLSLFAVVALMLSVLPVFDAQAAESENISITVSLSQVLSVSLSSANIALGTVAPGSVTVSESAITVTNNGSGPNEVFTLSHSTSGDWTSAAEADVNAFLLEAAFAESAATAVWAGVNSVVSDSVGFYDSVPLWFKFHAPTASDSTAQQTITVTVTAQLP